MASVVSGFKSASSEQQLSVLNEVLCYYARTSYGMDLPSDFVLLSILGMQNLQRAGKVNVIYELAKGLGVMRPGGKDSCFPTSRMPMGMLQYMVQFFNAKPGQNVSGTLAFITDSIDNKTLGFLLR